MNAAGRPAAAARAPEGSGGVGPLTATERPVSVTVAAPDPQPEIPAYLQNVYAWAYLNPRTARLLDRDIAVSWILMGNSGRLRRALLAEMAPGQLVLNIAHVYGSLIPAIADLIGPRGRLDVFDISPVQIARCRQKLAERPWSRVRHGDARLVRGDFDVVSCFFLLHEVPSEWKTGIVNAALAATGPKGKAVFIDYHKPRWWHPAKLYLSLIFRFLEPFAAELWRRDIAEYATRPEDFFWRKKTCFGETYQVVVATRQAPL